ncbi:MAG: hypothetical protein WCS77_01705 [Elusimicrobiaceae bacterium]
MKNLLVILAVLIAAVVYFKIKPAAYSVPGGQISSALTAVVPSQVPSPPQIFELDGAYPPLDLLPVLMDAPFGREAGSIEGWRTDLSNEECEEIPRYSKRFVRKGRGMGIELFAYAVPSLTEGKELVLSGEVRISSGVALESAIELLKSGGFEVTKVDYKGYGGWTDSFTLKKGALSGDLYYKHSLNGENILVVLNHKDKAQYSAEIPRPERLRYSRAMKAKLADDARLAGVDKLLGANWPEVKAALERKPAPVEKLLAARNVLLKNMPDGPDSALFLVLDYFIVEGIFGAVNRSVVGYADTVPELKLLDENKIAYEVEHFSGGYEPVGHSLEPAYRKSPESYWGQYALAAEMEDGFNADVYKLFPPDLIPKCERVLTDYPDSPFRAWFLFLAGKAYENNYSAGFVLNDSEQKCDKNDCAAMIRDGELYRLGALTYYETVLSLPDGKMFKEHLRFVLPKLRAKGNPFCDFYTHHSCS